MKLVLRTIFTLMAATMVVGCNSSVTKLTRPDGVNVTCAKPPKDVVTIAGSLNIESLVPDITRDIKMGITVNTTVQRIRKEIPNLQAVVVLEYRMCLAYGSNALTSAEYGKFVKGLLPLLKNNNEEMVSLRYINEVSFIEYFCVVKPKGVSDPYSACDSSRGDKQLHAGNEAIILVPVDPKLIPSGSEIKREVKVTGGSNFHLFEKIRAEYINGHIEMTVTPNDTGGFNDPVNFVISYTQNN